METPVKIYLTEDNPSKEWYRTKQQCAVIDLEKNIFIEAFKRGLRHERKKWQKFKWRNPLEKPEPEHEETTDTTD